MRVRKVSLLIALALLIMPITANAQEGWVARNIYAINQSIGFGMSVDYNDTSNELSILLMNNGMATQNIGLAILEVVFGDRSIPNKIDAYLLIDNETVEYQDQLINWSITPVTWTFGNETDTSSFYAYAYIYLFANQSIINETSQRPYYEDILVGASFNVNGAVLASHVMASDSDPVYVDYSFGEDSGILVPVIAGVVIGVGAFIFVLVVLWSRKR